MRTFDAEFFALLCLSCCFVDPGADAADSEDASTDTGADAATLPLTTSTVPTTSPASTTNAAEDDDGDASSSDSSGSSDPDSSTGDNASSESGEAAPETALFFDGDDEASTAAVVQATLPPEFTVELWVEITDDPFFGVLIDTRLPGSMEGWILLVDPPWWTNRLILNWSAADGSGGHGITGPEVDTLAPGWHHWAFTRDATGLVKCWIDGVSIAEGPSALAPVSQLAPIVVGRHPTEEAASNLWWRGAALDDIHISNVARYTTTSFLPEQAEADANSVLLWHFDEGEGDVAIDEVSGVELMLSSPVWVEGY